MGGGAEDHFLEGSVLGASFWRWWNRAWTGEPAGGEDQPQAAPAKEQIPQPRPPVASEELVFITAVVPRPRPPRPAKSQPIDIPTRKRVSVPIFESVAKDKRYWYQ